MKTKKTYSILKNRKVYISVLSSIFLIFSFAASAASINWTGGATGDWVVASNWSSAAVPTSVDDVTIPVGSTVTLSSDAGKINKLSVQGKLIVTSTGVLVIEQGVVSGTSLVEINGGEVENTGSITINQLLNNTNSGLNFATNANADGKFTNTGTFVINTSACTTSFAGPCISFSQSAAGRTAHLNLGGTLNFTPHALSFIMQVVSGNAQIDGTAVFGSSSNYLNYRLIHISNGNLTLASTANLTYYSGLASTAGAVNFSTNSNSVLTNNGSITIHGGSTTTGYGIYLNPQTSRSATFTNAGTINIDGNFPVACIGLAGADATSSSILNNLAGATITASNSTTGGPTALTATTTPTTTLNNAGTMTLSSSSGKAITFGGNSATFNNNSGGIVTVNKLITGSHPTNACTYNNNTGAIFNFEEATNTSDAISNSQYKVVFNNNGGKVTGRGTFYDGTFNPSTGTISPGTGGAAGVGMFYIQGMMFSLTGNLEMNVNGKTTGGVDYDQVIYSTNSAVFDISGANLTAIVGGSYVPVKNDVIYLVSPSGNPSGTLYGTFNSVSIPSNWEMQYTANAKMVCLGPPTGIENVNELNAKVYASINSIVVNLDSYENVQFEIIDLTGKLIKKSFLSNKNNTISMGNLKGIFVVRLSKLGDTYVQKVCLK